MIIEIDGYKVIYEMSGPEASDRSAVILQGWGTEFGMYDSVAAAVCDRFRVVQLDLPGFGASDEPPEAWSVDDYCDFFCRFMAEIGIGRATLIGHSYGGRMIIKMAARSAEGRLPFEIDKIVLVDSAGVMPKRTGLQKLRVMRYKVLRKFLTSAPVHAMFPEVIDYWISKQGSEDYRNASPVMKQCLVKAVNEDLQDFMPSVKQETLLVWGDLDEDTPISDARIMEDRMPNAALVTIEGAGHYSFLEQPVFFKNVLRSFLNADKVSEDIIMLNSGRTVHGNRKGHSEKGGDAV